MDMPRRPVEWIPTRDFVPTHCPWKECSEHSPGPRSSRYRFHHHGYYERKCAPHRIPRFRCCRCKRTYSRQTFSTTYYAKRPKLLSLIAGLLQASACFRQIARTLGCAHATVGRAAARLGRHCMLLLARALTEIGPVDEPLVIDHFEAFELSLLLRGHRATQRRACAHRLGAGGHSSREDAQRAPSVHRLLQEGAAGGGSGGRLCRSVSTHWSWPPVRASWGGRKGTRGSTAGLCGS